MGYEVQTTQVAPYVGAWIETRHLVSAHTMPGVAPYVGAWIETVVLSCLGMGIFGSHPMWVRGLKQYVRHHEFHTLGRTLCGCVD